MENEKKVALLIPKIPGIKNENVLIWINGKCYQIPRGKKVMVPQAVKTEYELSVKAQEKYEENAAARAYKDPMQAGQDDGGSAGVVD